MHCIPIIISLLFSSIAMFAQPVVEVNTRKAGADIASTMYGIFFEDINYGADGGLYAELVKNRSFEYPQPLMGWNTIGGVEVKDNGPFDKCPHYVELSFSGKRDKVTGIENCGYLGMSMHGDAQYRFSVWASAKDGGEAQVEVVLRDLNSQEENFAICDTTLTVKGAEWKRYTIIMQSPREVRNASLAIYLKGSNAVRLDHISLFPVDTWNGHENGLRKDLAQALADLRPGVMRFPGGCIVEGATLDTRYNWKNSVGMVENRPLNETRWNYGKERTHFDYYQSYGLGFFEFFQFCEEIGCEPLPVVSCGMACQFNNDSSRKGDWLAENDSLKQFVQDAIDLIEFCNGDPATNEWARLRADMGHPAPFNLKCLGIGNEQWGEWYVENLKAFLAPIRKKYPEISIVGSSGPWADGKEYDYLWPEMRKVKADLVDEHYYRNEDFFLSNVDRYDSYPRKGSKVFAGEYACHGVGKKWNRLYSSICEAALMTGLERNADIVRMATYAPLFAHIDGWQWRPDMIWFDNLRSVRTASYYVQQLFSQNKGTNVLPTVLKGAGKDNLLYASAVVDKKDNGAVIVKIVNASDKAQTVRLNLNGMKGRHQSVITTFGAGNLKGEKGNVNYGAERITDVKDCDNSLDNPQRLVPVTVNGTLETPSATLDVPANTVMVVKIVQNS